MRTAILSALVFSVSLCSVASGTYGRIPLVTPLISSNITANIICKVFSGDDERDWRQNASNLVVWTEKREEAETESASVPVVNAQMETNVVNEAILKMCGVKGE